MYLALLLDVRMWTPVNSEKNISALYFRGLTCGIACMMCCGIATACIIVCPKLLCFSKARYCARVFCAAKSFRAPLHSSRGMAAPSHWDQVADKHAAEINAIIADLESGDNGQIQSVGAKLLDILESSELSYKALFHHGRVGVSSCNREGSMLCADNVHQLLTRFTEKGWNAREAETGLAGEIGEGERCRI